MAAAIRLTRTGDARVLELTQVIETAPGPGEVWLEQQAIGVNYLDAMQRSGAVAIPLPNGIGLEAAGRVAAIGPDVSNVVVGDRVAYALGPLGSYASHRLYPAARLVKLPDDISVDDATAVVFKGITAQYLIKSTYPVGPGTVVLLYGVAGAVGQLLAPWARHLGATVIGVVSKQASVERALAAGCNAALVWGACELPAEVSRLTDGRKADVVYDGLGKLTFSTSLDCLRPRGMLVSMGASTGAPPPVDMGTLNAKGSLFVTRPGLAAHATDITEYRTRVQDVFDAVRQGIVAPKVWNTFSLADASRAHEAMETGASQGTILLKP